MLKESNLQHFRPSLSYHLSLRTLFCQFLSGRLRQFLLYSPIDNLTMVHLDWHILSKSDTVLLADFVHHVSIHLFTYRQFDNGVLGLAYIASERHSAVGGLCSPCEYTSSVHLS